MRIRLFVTCFVVLPLFVFAANQQKSDTIQSQIIPIDTDQLLDSLVENQQFVYKKDSLLAENSAKKTAHTNTNTNTNSAFHLISMIDSSRHVQIDSLLLQANPLFIELVYKYPEPKLEIKKNLLPYTLTMQKPVAKYSDYFYKKIQSPEIETSIVDLRKNALHYISIYDPDLIRFRYEELPSTENIKGRIIKNSDLPSLQLVADDNYKKATNSKMAIKSPKLNPWTKKANALTQFSQNLISSNWYQGGNSTMAVLGVLSGQLNYDNKKNLVFENSGEWRMGFYFVDDTTALRTLNVNNDILKLNSKLGYKINGNWYYSGSVDFSTQFLNNYNSVSSDQLKASFLSPVRFNAGIGLDYKYKKILSVSMSPLAYKYIYINEKDPDKLNPNLFGIETGHDHLSEVGSSFKAQLAYNPTREIQVNSTLSFFTNYSKVEIDWEVIGNFTINRFLSTRLSINPRYDNTVIQAEGEHARLQFKELLSFGFSYNLLD